MFGKHNLPADYFHTCIIFYRSELYFRFNSWWCWHPLISFYRVAFTFPQNDVLLATPRWLSHGARAMTSWPARRSTGDGAAGVPTVVPPGGKNSREHGEWSSLSWTWGVVTRGGDRIRWVIPRTPFLFSDCASYLASNIGLVFWHGRRLLVRYFVMMSQTPSIPCGGLH